MNLLFKPKPDLTTTPNQNPFGPKRILVADDEPCIRLLNVTVLRWRGFEADEAENGLQAWEKMNERHYDLLLSDHDMPEMTGLQLVHKLRSEGFGLPVVFASGRLPLDFLARNPWLNNAVLVPKPFTVDQLVTAVERFVPPPSAEAVPLVSHQPLASLG